MPELPPPTGAPAGLSRRSLLAAAGAGAGLVLLGAGCGRDEPDRGLNLLVVTPEVQAGVESRMVFVLQDNHRDPVRPRRAVFQLGSSPDRFDGPRVEATIHDDADPAPSYLTMTAVLEPPGTAFVRVEADGRTATAPVVVVPRLRGVAPGDRLPAVETPTMEDPAGVELVCTRQPEPCPWHQHSLDEPSDRPQAVLVATPAFCKTAVCGPALDVLLAAAPAVGDRVRFTHLEVYAERPRERLEVTPLAPAVKALGIPSEPVLFLVGADGVVRERIEGIFGRAEATSALERLTA